MSTQLRDSKLVSLLIDFSAIEPVVKWLNETFGPKFTAETYNCKGN
jgi:hypothetical protein